MPASRSHCVPLLAVVAVAVLASLAVFARRPAEQRPGVDAPTGAPSPDRITPTLAGQPTGAAMLAERLPTTGPSTLARHAGPSLAPQTTAAAPLPAAFSRRADTGFRFAPPGVPRRSLYCTWLI